MTAESYFHPHRVTQQITSCYQRVRHEKLFAESNHKISSLTRDASQLITNEITLDNFLIINRCDSHISITKPST